MAQPSATPTRVATTGAGDGIRFSASGNASHGASYTASVYLRAGTPSDVGKVVQVFADAAGGTYEQFSTDHTLSLLWERVTLSLAWNESDHVGWAIAVRDAIGQGAFTFDCDAAQYEIGEASSYADGSRGSGFAWDGRAHQSPGVRLRPTLSAPVALGSQGGLVAVGLMPLWAADDGKQHQIVTIDQYFALEGTAEGNWRVTVAGATAEVPQAHASGDPVTLIAEWSRSRLLLWADQVGAVTSIDASARPARGELSFGSTSDNAATEGILIGGVVYPSTTPESSRRFLAMASHRPAGWATL